MEKKNIWNRIIVLYGDSKIKRNFKYLFKKIAISQLDIDNDLDYIKENGGEYLIVFCNEKEDKIFERKMQKAGLELNKDYVYIREFFLYYNPMFIERGNRKLAVWGTGRAAEELWTVLEEKGLAAEVDFYIDNADDKKFFKGKKVFSPIKIKERDDVYIIVATYEYQWEIYKQLEMYGFFQIKDFIHCNAVKYDYMPLLEKVCFAKDRYPYKCHRPFGYCDIIGDNVFLCCPDFLSVSAGSMKSESFMSCWDSYIARILRLSISNGTYVFCNKQYCDLFDFDEKQDVSVNVNEEKFFPSLKYPKTLMVGIDYSCNLKCPSCREKLCVAKGEERKEIDRQAEDLLQNVIPNVERLWMAGCGEVFFSPTYINMLKDERCKARKQISILSNGALFDEEKWRFLRENYSSIEIVISVDGICDETLERLRKGVNAKKLKRNLEFLGKMRKQNKIDKLYISCVLQADNVAEIYDLLKYSKNIGVDKVQFLKLKDNGIYTDRNKYNEMSIFDTEGRLKEAYKSYFTKELVQHPLADWFNNVESLGVGRKERLDEYDTF